MDEPYNNRVTIGNDKGDSRYIFLDEHNQEWLIKMLNSLFKCAEIAQLFICWWYNRKLFS